MKNLIIDETGNNLKYDNDRIRNLANFEKFLSKNDLKPNSAIVTLFCFLYEMSQKMNFELINEDKKICFVFTYEILS
jgi:hypothetical protein